MVSIISLLRQSSDDEQQKTYLHSNGEDDPGVLVHIVHFNRVVDFLLSRAEETTEGVNEFVVNRACTQVVTLILHDGHLRPLICLHLVFLHRVQALLAREAAQNIDVPSALRDRVSISTFVHGRLVSDLILESPVESGVLFGRRASTRDKDVARSQGNGG